ncbi:riboflavin transporter MCH5 [Aspergillus udagawae]|uniref:Riboflavin transporter MCH5 n=1 Tax=Aspergillus udagawae TaxID=91492 RepID=A0ABQ1BA42_9EURO|nr:riboflavin transporter MCH5 [Aspergillus udagawae]GFF63143.1 riboflavin transporter MCH5 [Aspergillus udagawae]GFF97176.1 riboflavin transporter MCH5 [Aspergillus udagawae]
MLSDKEINIEHGAASSLKSNGNEPQQRQEPSPIPNGGLAAWSQVLGAHLLFFNSWGIVNTYGTYQAYYESDLLRSRSSSEISWIGTFQGFLLIFFSIVGGPIFDRGYIRPLLMAGTSLTVFGMMMTSLATTYWQIFLAQGLCVGLGCGCLFLPSVAIVATYFSTRRALATGITAAGGSLGSVIYPIIFRRLQPQVGAGWATRIIAFIALATLMISVLIAKPRLSPSKKSRRLVDPDAFKSSLFVLYNLGSFFAFVGLYIPFFYLIIYAHRKIGIAEDISFYLLSVINASSIFGRIIPGLLADRFGALEVSSFCALACAVLSYSWITIDNLGGLVTFCTLYGFFSGAVVSLPPTVIATLVPSLEVVGTWMGMSFTAGATGLLIGNPLAGLLIDVEEGEFARGFIFAASMIMAATIIYLIILVAKGRRERRLSKD